MTPLTRAIRRQPFALNCSRISVLYTLSAFLLLLTQGCTAVKVVAVLAPPPTVEAQYTRFAGQSVAVMAWADRGIRIDWPTLPLDLANSVQNKLMKQTGKKQVFEGALFPLSPQSVVRYQEDHPEAEFAPIEVTAAKLRVSRVIYVEVEDFTTRSDTAGELFLGRIKASLKVIEVQGGVGVIAYEERDIEVQFPESAPPEGTIKGSDMQMYVGAIEILARRIQDRFVPYLMDK